MEKLTYKEFDEEMKKIGLRTQENDLNISVYSDKALVAAVNRSVVGMMTTYYGSFEWLDQIDRYVLTMACHKLTMTYPEDREDPKKYYLRLKPQFDYLKRYSPSYLIRDSVRGDDMCVSNIAKMAFTDAQIKDMSKTYDLSIFKKVEAEDD